MGWLVLLGLVAGVVYVVRCVVDPWVDCDRCDAGPQRVTAYRCDRACRRCRGTGKRVRWGRRMIDRATRW